jgi:hypothetical protein
MPQIKFRWGLQRKSRTCRIWSSHSQQQRGNPPHHRRKSGAQHQQCCRNMGTPLHGLQAAKDQEIFPIIAEGDSQIVINLLSHLLNGADPEKISPRWRLMNGLLIIKSILQPQWVILPSHVRRSTNQVVDLLANYGVDLEEGDFSCSPTSPSDGVFPGSERGQITGRPSGQTTATWRLIRPAPPHPSPHGFKTPTVTLQTLLAANLSHALEAQLRGRFHGAGQDASTVTSTPQQ